MRRTSRVSLATAVFLLFVEGAFAQGLKPPEIHAFGGWAHGRTDEGELEVASEDGVDNVSFALNLTQELSDSVRVNAQLFWDRGEGQATVDYAFVAWRITTPLELRLGEVKQPFGNYAEIFDVGTLRPFYFLPDSIYGEVPFISESYRGVGLTGKLAEGRGWRADFDVYAGSLSLASGEEDHEGSLVRAAAENEEEEAAIEVKDLVGGRVTITSPVPGLSAGLSAFSGSAKEDDARHSVTGLNVAYLANRLWLRAEIARAENEDLGDRTGQYIEASYKLTDHWQVALRYDRAEVGEDEEAESSREYAAGINYWINSNAVVKLSSHDLESDDGDPRILLVGVQFSF